METAEEGEGGKVVTLADYARVLRGNAVYRALFLTYCIDNCGNWLTLVACISAIERLEANAMDTSLFLICRLLPSIVFAGIMGPIADRYNKITLLIVCNIGAALSILLLAVSLPMITVHGKRPTLMLIYVLTLSQFTFSALYEPARRSLLPLVVGREDLIVATSLDGLAWSTVGAFGATLGGYVNSWFGANISFCLDAISYLVCACWMFALPHGAGAVSGGQVDLNSGAEGTCSVPELLDHSSPWPGVEDEDNMQGDVVGENDDFAAALVYLHKRGFCLLVCLMKGAGALVWGVSALIAVKISQNAKYQTLGDESVTLGLMFALEGVGCQIGPILWNIFTPQRERPLLFAVVISFVQMGLSYALMAYSQSIWQIFVCTASRAMGSCVIWVYSTLLLQLTVDVRFLGRVFAIELAFRELCDVASIAMGGLIFDRLELKVEDACSVMGGVGSVVGLLWVVVYGARYYSICRAAVGHMRGYSALPVANEGK